MCPLGRARIDPPRRQISATIRAEPIGSSSTPPADRSLMTRVTAVARRRPLGGAGNRTRAYLPPKSRLRNPTNPPPEVAGSAAAAGASADRGRTVAGTGLRGGRRLAAVADPLVEGLPAGLARRGRGGGRRRPSAADPLVEGLPAGLARRTGAPRRGAAADGRRRPTHLSRASQPVLPERPPRERRSRPSRRPTCRAPPSRSCPTERLRRRPEPRATGASDPLVEGLPAGLARGGRRGGGGAAEPADPLVERLPAGLARAARRRRRPTTGAADPLVERLPAGRAGGSGCGRGGGGRGGAGATDPLVQRLPAGSFPRRRRAPRIRPSRSYRPPTCRGPPSLWSGRLLQSGAGNGEDGS